MSTESEGCDDVEDGYEWNDVQIQGANHRIPRSSNATSLTILLEDNLQISGQLLQENPHLRTA